MHFNTEELEAKFNVWREEWETRREEWEARMEQLKKEIVEYVNAKVNRFSRISEVVEEKEEFVKTPTQKIRRFLYNRKKEGGTARLRAWERRNPGNSAAAERRVAGSFRGAGDASFQKAAPPVRPPLRMEGRPARRNEAEPQTSRRQAEAHKKSGSPFIGNPLVPYACGDYSSAATTLNFTVAFTSRWSLATASYSPTVLTPSTTMALRSSSTPLAASASARSAAVTVPKSLPSSAFTVSTSGRLAIFSARACASARILASLCARCFRFSARTLRAEAVAAFAEALGNQVVVCITGLHGHDVVGVAQILDIFDQNDFHFLSSSVNYFMQSGYEGQNGEVTGTLHGLGHLLLELLRRTGQATGQNLALLVEELFEELAVLVIHILDAELLEAAVFLFFTSTDTGLRYRISDCAALFSCAMVYSSCLLESFA